jgi:hypothetical protein
MALALFHVLISSLAVGRSPTLRAMADRRSLTTKDQQPAALFYFYTQTPARALGTGVRILPTY